MVRRCVYISEGITAQSIGFAEKEAQLFVFDDSNRSSEYLHSYNHVRTRATKSVAPSQKNLAAPGREERERRLSFRPSSASVTASCMGREEAQ